MQINSQNIIARLFPDLADYPFFRRIIWKSIYETPAKKLNPETVILKLRPDDKANNEYYGWTWLPTLEYEEET